MINIKFNPIKTIWTLVVVIFVLITSLVVTDVNLQDQRKQTIAQASFCIKNTADVMANYQLALIREKDAHQRDIDEANAKIEDLVNEYNKLLKKPTTKRDPLNLYSYLIHPKIS